MKRMWVFLSLFPLTILTAGWTKTYGDMHDDYGECVHATKDGGYVVTGYFTQKGSKDLWIAKVDSKGNVN
jgi:hypothetical protein